VLRYRLLDLVSAPALSITSAHSLPRSGQLRAKTWLLVSKLDDLFIIQFASD
jgi:hypothetical protein